MSDVLSNALSDALHPADARLLQLVQERAATVEQDLIFRRLVSSEAIAAERPDPATPAAEVPAAWLGFWRWLERTHAVEMARDARGGSAAATEPATAAAERAVLDDVLAAALAEEPVRVRLSTGTTCAVHPKSYHALRFLDHLDAELVVIAREWAVARQAEASSVREDAIVQALAPLAESLAVRLWCWIVTHPGPRLPFDETDVLPEANAFPAWLAEISPDDLLALFRAHLEVNGRRLDTIARAFPPEPGERQEGQDGPSRLTLSGFLGTMVKERGGSERRVMRETSLGALFASAAAQAEQSRAALRDAKRDAAQHRAGSDA